jgi:hypothetical protein
MKKKLSILFVFICISAPSLFSQQVADTTFNPELSKPEYPAGKGPLVFIDEGHNNFHTAEGRYLPFARLLRQDGYRVEGYRGKFNIQHLKEAGILVISNALNRVNATHWYLPTPSAFTPGEIKTVKQWVTDGGSLFLIADHMPMGGAAADLAAAFGFTFTNGFAADTSSSGITFFYRKDNTLISNTITNGRNMNESVDKVVTFTGQAFKIPSGSVPILVFNDRYTLLETDTAWVFGSNTRYTPIKGWSQGAYMNYGKGRLVFFGEAAMFSAQIAGPQKAKIGMNSDYAEENYKLLLNIIHWLDRRFD